MESLIRLQMTFYKTTTFLLLTVASMHAQGKRPADLLLLHGTVVTMDQQRRVLDNGAVAIRNELIEAIGPSDEIASAYQANGVIDARGAIIMPGLINAHTHMAMSLFRGLAEDRSLQDWLQKFIFPAEARNR